MRIKLDKSVITTFDNRAYRELGNADSVRNSWQWETTYPPYGGGELDIFKGPPESELCAFAWLGF